MAQDDPVLATSFLRSAIAACIAETLTIPFDTAKVRLQLQLRSAAGNAPPHYKGPIGTLRTIVREEGILAPFKGLTAGLHRQFIFTGLRLGLYEELCRRIASFDPAISDSSVAVRTVAALTTSAVGITAANPSDVVKVRFQAQHGQVSGATAGTGQYRSAVRAYVDIARSEGVIGGLYKGYGPNLLRNSIISATEIVTYDVTKQKLLELGFDDSPMTHFTAGTTAGFAATVLGSPWDVLGTRLMADTSRLGVLPYVVKMLREEGVSSFYKGFLPNFARIGSFNITLWVAFEQLRKLL